MDCYTRKHTRTHQIYLGLSDRCHYIVSLIQSMSAMIIQYGSMYYYYIVYIKEKRKNTIEICGGQCRVILACFVWSIG